MTWIIALPFVLFGGGMAWISFRDAGSKSTRRYK
jgi:hypothetical protein